MGFRDRAGNEVSEDWAGEAGRRGVVVVGEPARLGSGRDPEQVDPEPPGPCPGSPGLRVSVTSLEQTRLFVYLSPLKYSDGDLYLFFTLQKVS